MSGTTRRRMVSSARRHAQGHHAHGEGLQEICINRRMGVPGVGWRRSHEADRHQLGETMLQLPCAAEGAGLHVLEVSRVTGALAEPGATRLLCPREAAEGAQPVTEIVRCGEHMLLD